MASPMPDGVWCPCFHPDPDPDAELGEETCVCGHVLDEHDELGQCWAEVAGDE